MKKTVALILLMVFMLGLAQVVFAQLREKKAELEKVKKYLVLLDNKIKKARAARKINKIAELKEIKRKELARAKALKGEIARLEKRGMSAKDSPKAIARKGGLQVSGGYGAGGGLIGAGYLLPVAQNVDLAFEAGLGIGSGFTVLVADVASIVPLGRNFVGLELGMASYSRTVNGVPGIGGNIGGSNFGAGVFGGTTFGALKARIGYNTALGLTAAAVYRL